MKRPLEPGNLTMTNETSLVVYATTPLSEAQIVRRRQLTWLLYVLIFLAIASACYWVLPFAEFWPHSMLDRFMDGLTGLTIGMLVDSLLAQVAAVAIDKHSWLASSQCEGLADLFDENPEIAPYREQVRAQARRFTWGEYRAMRAWIKKVRRASEAAATVERERLACQRLYGTPTHTPSVAEGSKA